MVIGDYIFVFFVLGPSSVLTPVHQNLEGERNILDINLSFLPHNWTNSLYPRFAAKVHVYSSIFNFAPQNFRSPGFYLHHPQGCS